MLKLSKTIINPPNGIGYDIKAIEISYYDTEDPLKIDKSQLFKLGQLWSRGDNFQYEIQKLILLLDKNKNTKLEAIMKISEGPQLLNVNLLTLVRFWTLLNFDPDYAIINKDNRFDVID